VASLSRLDVEHVATLARLGLSPEEVTLLEGQLNHILEQFAVLSELDTDDISPTAQTIAVESILREDSVRPGFDRSVVLSLAPAHSGEHVIVPAVLDDADPDR